MIFHETCDVITKVRGARDDLGIPSTTTTSKTARCELTPLAGAETIDPSTDRVTTRLRVFLPAGTQVTPADQITWRGTTFEVQGSVEVHIQRGRVHHLECIVAEVSG